MDCEWTGGVGRKEGLGGRTRLECIMKFKRINKLQKKNMISTLIVCLSFLLYVFLCTSLCKQLPFFFNLCDVPHFFVCSNLVLLFPLPTRLALHPKILMVFLLVSLHVDCMAWLFETLNWGPNEARTMRFSWFR